jgi:hypothetical protein
MRVQRREFYVLCRERCPACGGSGVIASGRRRRRPFVVLSGDQIPCPNCEGEGRLEYPVPLLQALEELLGETDQSARSIRSTRGA